MIDEALLLMRLFTIQSWRVQRVYTRIKDNLDILIILLINEGTKTSWIKDLLVVRNQLEQ